MDAVSLVEAALVAGATAGITDTSAAAVRDAYDRLKELVLTRLAGVPNAEEALERHEMHPQRRRPVLGPLLLKAVELEDPEVTEAANRVLALTKHVSTAYSLKVGGDVQGLQQGDHSHQTNRWSSR
jgi:hypothetical protein